MIVEKLAEITRNLGKNERLDEPKTRKGGSCKNEIETKGNWLYLANYHPLEAQATNKWLLSSVAVVPVNSKFPGTVMITVFNVPPTNKITIFQSFVNPWSHAFGWLLCNTPIPRLKNFVK